MKSGRHFIFVYTNTNILVNILVLVQDFYIKSLQLLFIKDPEDQAQNVRINSFNIFQVAIESSIARQEKIFTIVKVIQL